MRILLIVQPERVDFYNYLAAAQGVEWVLLWYESADQDTGTLAKLPLPFSKVYYWADFATPKSLLEQVKPDRIIFFEIIDLRQIALIVSSKAKGIPTFFLEHGAAGDVETALVRSQEMKFREHKLPYLLNRIKTGLFHSLRSKLFYYSVRKGFTSFTSYQKYLLLPFKMLASSPNLVLRKNLFPERVPDQNIVFNQTNLEEFSLYTGVKKSDALLTGVPFFDKYYKNGYDIGSPVVYIDHPYFEESLLNWNSSHHQMIAEALISFAEKRGVELFIKLHPRSDKHVWDRYINDHAHVRIIQTGDYTDLFLQARLIMGYSSSLINGFLCARKNVVLLGWHPEPRIFGSDFSKYGLCHVSFSPEDLEKKFDHWIQHNLAEENEAAYLNFLERFNYPFDGKAAQRVIEALTGVTVMKTEAVQPL